MGAQIIELSRVAAARSSCDSEAVAGGTQRFDFWPGASGRQYVHGVYSLIDCPELPRCNYVLVRRERDGRRRVLRISIANHEAPSLNLAEIRHRGAKAGANEVHVHLLANSDRERGAVEHDLLGASVREKRSCRARP